MRHRRGGEGERNPVHLTLQGRQVALAQKVPPCVDDSNPYGRTAAHIATYCLPD